MNDRVVDETAGAPSDSHEVARKLDRRSGDDDNHVTSERYVIAETPIPSHLYQDAVIYKIKGLTAGPVNMRAVRFPSASSCRYQQSSNLIPTWPTM
jgi:hypothetical protein